MTQMYTICSAWDLIPSSLVKTGSTRHLIAVYTDLVCDLLAPPKGREREVIFFKNSFSVLHLSPVLLA